MTPAELAAARKELHAIEAEERVVKNDLQHDETEEVEVKHEINELEDISNKGGAWGGLPAQRHFNSSARHRDYQNRSAFGGAEFRLGLKEDELQFEASADRLKELELGDLDAEVRADSGGQSLPFPSPSDGNEVALTVTIVAVTVLVVAAVLLIL